MTQEITINEGSLVTPGSADLLLCSYSSLVNAIGRHVFGKYPTSVDVITDGVVSARQQADILRVLARGLQYVYSAHRWSFLNPIVTLTTYPPYQTGTVTVDASGNVTGVGTVFPSYSASAGGWMTIPSSGTYQIGTYTSGTALALTGFDDDAIVTAVPYFIGFNHYAMPAGVESLLGDLTYPRDQVNLPVSLNKVPELHIRKLLAQSTIPNRPTVYAETVNDFDPTLGSSKYISLYPTPDAEYTLSATGSLTPQMIDRSNQYPVGSTALAPVFVESVLAAAERDIEQKDELHPDAVHCRELKRVLADAIRKDRESSAPDTVGILGDSEPSSQMKVGCRKSGQIYWDAGGDYTGYL